MGELYGLRTVLLLQLHLQELKVSLAQYMEEVGGFALEGASAVMQ